MKEKILEAFAELNEEARAKWEDHKIIELLCYEEGDFSTTIEIAIGRWERTYHTLTADEGGIHIVGESSYNPITDEIIMYVLNPIFYGND